MFNFEVIIFIYLFWKTKKLESLFLVDKIALLFSLLNQYCAVISRPFTFLGLTVYIW